MTRLYPYLILVGLSIIAATAWLLREYRKQLLRNRELIQLNEQLGYDLPDFLRQCWEPLKRGGFCGLQWELLWFGTRLSGEEGEAAGNRIDRRLEVQEILLNVTLYTRQRSGERRWFASTLADNFFLLLRMNMWIKVGSIQGAFEQSARMAVFLQHDVKNLVQLITLASEQVQDPIPSGQERVMLKSVQATLPAVRDRARQLLDNLKGFPASTDVEEFELATMVRQTASLHELVVQVSGEAHCRLEPGRLQGIFDNLFSNYSREIHRQERRDCDIRVEVAAQDKRIQLTISDLKAPPFKRPERLFEPFWSEHGAGRGIGLYQARQQAEALGGTLKASTDVDRPLTFHLQLPVSQENFL